MNYKRQLFRDSALFSGINIVPFTDIVLVLLIIFMLSAPALVHSKLGLKLPQAKNEDLSLSESLNLALDPKGNIFIEGSQIDLPHLADRLKKHKTLKPTLTVNIDADQNAKHGQVIALLDLLRNLKIEKIYVGTRKK